MRPVSAPTGIAYKNYPRGMDSGISAYTSVGRLLIKTIPAVMGMYEIRSDPTGIDTGMTCALAFWLGGIQSQCNAEAHGCIQA